MLAGGDFHELRDGGHFLGETDLVDHHGDDEGMRVRKYRGKDESGALRGGGVSRTSELAYGEILKIPFPTGERAGKTAQQAIRVRRGEQLDGGADALAARFVQASFQQGQNRHADGAHQARHGREKFRAARLGEEQGQAVQQALRITMQEARQNRVERAIGKRGVDEQQPAVLRDQAMR